MDKLKEKRARMLQNAQDLREKAEKDSREMTEEEWTQFNSHIAEADGLQKSIETEESKLAAFSALDGKLEDLNTIDSAQTVAKNVAIVQDHKELIKEDPKCGFKKQSDFYLSVMESFKANKVMDNRLNFLAAAGGDEHSTFADPYGGFFVPEAFSTNYLSRAPETDFTLGRTTNVPMSNPTVKIPARVDNDHSSSVSGGMVATRNAEGDTSAAVRSQWSQVTLQAHGLYIFSYATNELLSDSPVSFATIIAECAGQEFGNKLLREKISGTGVGEFLGVRNSDAKIAVTAETGQTADTIVWQNIIKMRARVYGYSNAIWMANHQCITQLAQLTQDVGTGGVALYMPSAREDMPDSLLGRPLFYSEVLPSLGDAGTIMCVDWSQYLEGTYQGMQSAVSTAVRFLQNESCFRFHSRNCGLPWWATYLTPQNGDTLSPIVELGAVA